MIAGVMQAGISVQFAVIIAVAETAVDRARKNADTRRAGRSGSRPAARESKVAICTYDNYCIPCRMTLCLMHALPHSDPAPFDAATPQRAGRLGILDANPSCDDAYCPRFIMRDDEDFIYASVDVQFFALYTILAILKVATLVGGAAGGRCHRSNQHPMGGEA